MIEPAVLLIGAGGHARACIDVFETAGRFRVAGLVGLAHEVGSNVIGYSVLGTDGDLPDLKKSAEYALITVGQIKTAEPRIRLFELTTALGYLMPAVVSPHAYVSSHARLGAGTIVMHGAVINAGASIGRNCIVNSKALVEHDAIVADHCHVATGAIVNGGSTVGAGTFVGSGAHIREGVIVGARCVIGMLQCVRANLADGGRLPPREGGS